MGNGLFDLLTQKMSYLNQKQAVLAENVANVDTPGYKELSLKPFTFSDAMKQADMGMAVTDPRHIVPANMAGTNAKTFKTKGNDVQSNGNSVNLEGQLSEESKTSGDFQLAAAVYHKMVGLMKIAVKGSSS